jgi:hypothetical protein
MLLNCTLKTVKIVSFMLHSFYYNKTYLFSQTPVAHACDPSFWGDWDWEDCFSEPGQAKSSWDPIPINSCGVWYASVSPGYTGGWDIADHSSRPAQAKKKKKKNSWKTLSQPKKRLSMVAHAYHPSYSREAKIGRMWSRPALAKSKTLFLK